MKPTYEVRLMFEWGGACLWGMNQAAKDRFGYAEIERVLPLSGKTVSTLNELSVLHDTALNWSDPGGPSLWSREQFDEFELNALTLLEALKTDLGPHFSVWYRRLGNPNEE